MRNTPINRGYFPVGENINLKPKAKLSYCFDSITNKNSNIAKIVKMGNSGNKVYSYMVMSLVVM